MLNLLNDNRSKLETIQPSNNQKQIKTKLGENDFSCVRCLRKSKISRKLQK